jgi:cardiolipin synthase A/B
VQTLDDLISIVIRMISIVSSEKTIQLGLIIRNVQGPNETIKLNPWATSPLLREKLNQLIECWKGTEVSAKELSGILIGASHAHNAARTETSLELVWTGPATHQVSTRKTEQALLEVINKSKKNLFFTCFVTYKAKNIIAAIKKAIERGVEISILMESSDDPQDGIFVNAINKMKQSLPEAKIFDWKKKEAEFEGGKVHSKLAVADNKICFISSANLTEYAMEKNIEAGILIHGGMIPEKLHEHLEALVVTKVITLA